DPMSSRLPANVELMASTRHTSDGFGKPGTVLRHRITAGTLEIRFDNVAITPLTTVAARHGVPPCTTPSARRSIHATAPVCSKPPITPHHDAKNRSRDHSTRPT